MFFADPVEDFPEFIEVEGEIYQLDSGSEDEDELISRGEKIVEKNGMPVNSFEIRQQADHYALYIR